MSAEPSLPNDAYWAAERYQAIASRLAPISDGLCDRARLRAGESVLDVACATGNAALAAGRRQCQVTGIDTDENMLTAGRRRAQAEQLPITFRHADAQHLPFPDGAFDVVLSAYGAMFAPDRRATAAELLRVCRRSGRIVLAHWNPDSVITHMFRAIHELHPSTDPLDETARAWGTPQGLRDLFGPRPAIDARPAHRHVHAASSGEFATVFTDNFGPALKALSAAGDDRKADLHQRLADLFEQYNGSAPGADMAPIRIDYLEAIITPPA